MKVKEIKKIVYETIDGQQFDIESEAKKHETEILSDCITVEAAATILKKHCEHTRDCDTCPLQHKVSYKCKLKRDNTPEYWDI